MGLFGLGKKKAKVVVHGYSSTLQGADGRYKKMAAANEKQWKKQMKDAPMEAHTVSELCAYIEETYETAPLPESDEMYAEARERFSLSAGTDLCIYNLRVMQGREPAAWLTFYVDKTEAFLFYEITELECRDHYSVNRVIADVVTYFGITKEDKKQKTERYEQWCSAQYLSGVAKR